MKIVQLQAENVKRLSAVEIKPDGSVVVIGGKNGQGKSSVLDSIMYALGGGETLPAKPLRRGAASGKVVLDLGEMTVTRKFTQSGDDVRSTLEIKNKDGFKAGSPQAILDAICGRMAFDPLEFSRLKPKPQLDALRELVGLDFSKLDQRRAVVFESRTEVNRAIKAKQAEIDAMPAIENAPACEVSVSDAVAELERRQLHNRNRDAIRMRASNLETNAAHYVRQIKAVQTEIADLERRIEELRAQMASLSESRMCSDVDAKNARKEYEATEELDCEPIRETIRNAEKLNSAYRHNRKRADLVAELHYLQLGADGQTKELEAIDKEKSEAMKSAKFPVDGLGFDANGITLNGLPFSQASSAEQLRVSVAMGLALNPKLRVMLIRDGSLLDEESLALVNRMAEEAGAQIWVERVSQGDEVSVVIEDGHVKEEVAELVEA